MDPVAWDYEIVALCNGIHSKVGTGRGQIPNKAKPKPNWSLMLQSWRIEKNRLGGPGDSGTGEPSARPLWQGDERGMAPSRWAAPDKLGNVKATSR